MDNLDRMLSDLPEGDLPPHLAASIRTFVHQRHRRRQMMRAIGSAFLSLIGLWLLWPALAWLSSNELYVSSTPWLTGSLAYLNEESTTLLAGVWNGSSALQSAINSNLAVSILLGALVLGTAIFLAIDPASWQAAPREGSPGGPAAMATSGIHL